ncbi:PhzF family phenazine biosynthesis protein, partial [Candidatus Bathyarchaeota archaeon]|nr:PhzF family phenazine biosynthesis protein [Candidatus Bathyarchaeota archaeon]
KAILVFVPQIYHDENDLYVRFFIDYYNILEDPTKGSGNRCLSGYIMKHSYF